MNASGFALITTILSFLIATPHSWAALPETKSYDDAVLELNQHVQTISDSVKKIARLRQGLAHGDSNALDLIEVENLAIESAIDNSFALPKKYPTAFQTVWSKHTTAIRRLLWWTTLILVDTALIKGGIALGFTPGQMPPLVSTVGVLSLASIYSAEFPDQHGHGIFMTENNYKNFLLNWIAKKHKNAVDSRIIKILKAGICEDTLTLKPQSKIRL